jgi:hypothetical protein
MASRKGRHRAGRKHLRALLFGIASHIQVNTRHAWLCTITINSWSHSVWGLLVFQHQRLHLLLLP